MKRGNYKCFIKYYLHMETGNNESYFFKVVLTQILLKQPLGGAGLQLHVSCHSRTEAAIFNLYICLLFFLSFQIIPSIVYRKSTVLNLCVIFSHEIFTRLHLPNLTKFMARQYL